MQKLVVFQSAILPRREWSRYSKCATTAVPRVWVLAEANGRSGALQPNARPVRTSLVRTRPTGLFALGQFVPHLGEPYQWEASDQKQALSSFIVLGQAQSHRSCKRTKTAWPVNSLHAKFCAGSFAGSLLIDCRLPYRLGGMTDSTDSKAVRTTRCRRSRTRRYSRERACLPCCQGGWPSCQAVMHQSWRKHGWRVRLPTAPECVL